MTTITDVRREVTVAGTPERAFDLFTNRHGRMVAR